MARWLSALLCAAAVVCGQAPSLTNNLDFEQGAGSVAPPGWSGGPAETIFLDSDVVHGGEGAVRLERNASSQSTFSTVTRCGPLTFGGTSITLRGFLRSQSVSDFMGLWMREDGEAGPLGGDAFDNMQQRQIKGTTPWTQYSITLPLREEAKSLCFGFLISGTGKAWADDLELMVEGKTALPPAPPRPQPLQRDHEFDSGSGIRLSELTAVQTANLATLGKVWGYLKYHHPAVTAGERHWDYDLFRVLPQVLAAADRAEANAAMLAWIDALGPVEPCEACASLDETGVYMKPDLDWLRDEALLGKELSDALQKIHASRPAGHGQFFLTMAPGVGNPVFQDEPAYADLAFPDAGYQLLALYRLWNIVAYWSPNRDLVDGDWDAVLAEFVPRVALARDRSAYQLEMVQLIGRISDTHANLWSLPPAERPPTGDCMLPVVTRFVENDQLVVYRYAEAELGPATGLRIGDVIESIDGVPVADLVRRYLPYYPASNRPTQLRDLGRSLPRGACGEARLHVRRADGEFDLTATRVPSGRLNPAAASTHDLPGETFQRLAGDIAYLKLSSIKSADVADYVDRAAGTKGLIIDIRNYPSEFVVFTLGQLLVDRETPFVTFSGGDLENPGAFHWSTTLRLAPQQPRYAGKVMILVDEVTQSQAEYTTMAFRASPRAMVLGSTTAGADGNVSQIPLPGGLRTMISGIGVFHPDKSPTQRVGILPDVAVRPTIQGIREGRDELIEEAIRRIRAEP